MSNLKPTEKQQAVGVTGAAALVILWVLGQFGVEMDPTTAAAAVVVLAWAGGWIMPEGKGRRRATK